MRLEYVVGFLVSFALTSVIMFLVRRVRSRRERGR